MRDFGYFCPIELSVSVFAGALRVIHLVISLQYCPDYFSLPLAIPAFSANPLNNSKGRFSGAKISFKELTFLESRAIEIELLLVDESPAIRRERYFLFDAINNSRAICRPSTDIKTVEREIQSKLRLPLPHLHTVVRRVHEISRV